MAEENNVVAMTIEVVASYVTHNSLRPEDVPGFIAQTHAAITALTSVAQSEVPQDAPLDIAAPEHQAAVTVRKSLASREHILSMIDGKPYKTLKRHIARHGMTPPEYRERYGLKPDYPMTAPAYSEQRREVAKSLGLGRKASPPQQVSEAPTPEPQIQSEPLKVKRGRKPKVAVQAASEPASAPTKRQRRAKSADAVKTPAERGAEDQGPEPASK